ncbi:hypothetical protein DFH09DRAFT_1079391 [Mycena vulgaris]|nr:hypothetical protein DFH09DRAFT_1081940 [Mycena vulgaris]KAJ6572703.1 hypothetical protein DFH09DRAFT_1079391 [Mycena vulgaris]
MLHTLNEAHLPFYLFPNYPDHNNPELATVFKSWESLRKTLNIIGRVGIDECTGFCPVIDLKPTAPIPVELKGALKRKGDDQVNDKEPAKRAKPGPKKERKSGGNDASKRKRDDEIEQGKPPKRAKISRKKEGKNGGKNSTHKLVLLRPPAQLSL